MGNRAYMAFAGALLLALLAYAFRDEGAGPPPWDRYAVHSARVRPTWSLDLETGGQGTSEADLYWGMKARNDPYLATENGAWIALAQARWEALDARALDALVYHPNTYSARGADAPVKKGAVFALRTRAGHYARLRVKDIRGDDSLVLEWQLFAAPPPAPAGTQETATVNAAPKPAAKAPAKSKAGPPPAWQALREEALTAYREQRREDAHAACHRAIEASAAAGEAQRALMLVTCGGMLDLHRRYPEQIEDWLKRGKSLVLKLDQQAIVDALGAREAMLKERALRNLGVFYRDRKRPRDAADNFALAVDTVRAMPPPETPERRLALRADLHDLGSTLAALGYRAIARQALEEARALYVKTEPGHPALKAIDAQLQRLEAPQKK